MEPIQERPGVRFSPVTDRQQQPTLRMGYLALFHSFFLSLSLSHSLLNWFYTFECVILYYLKWLLALI